MTELTKRSVVGHTREADYYGHETYNKPHLT